MYAKLDAYEGGEKLSLEEVSANYLITFAGMRSNGTYGTIPAVLCKDFYAE